MNRKPASASRKLIDRLVPDERWGALHGFLATTYELQPDFLETDFLPSIFGLGAWDDRSWASRIAIEKQLAQLEAATVFMEARKYRGRPRSLRLEVVPVAGDRKLHAKVLLLVHEKAVRLLVASANLTDPGYRRNREVAAVLSADAKDGAAALLPALAGLEQQLDKHLTESACRLLLLARQRLESFSAADAPRPFEVAWSGGTVRLCELFMDRWPAAEPIERVTIVSPFWSEDSSVSLRRFLNSLGTRANRPLEVRLLTEAALGGETVAPVLPPSYAAADWASLGARVFAQAVDPRVLPEEFGGIEEPGGRRRLHAKIVVVEGPATALAYIGSGNFTARGWGTLGGHLPANIEAGLIQRFRRSDPALMHILPPLTGEAILLEGGAEQRLASPEPLTSEPPWPAFLREVKLSPSSSDDAALELVFIVAPAEVQWSAALPGKPEGIVFVTRTECPKAEQIRIAIAAEVLDKLLIEQEVLVRWSAYPEGRLVPVNVDPEARLRLPVAPGTRKPGESDLIAFYQGRISWEQLFPDPQDRAEQEQEPTPETGSMVDKSRIQTYQVREFVEALAGICPDLRNSAVSPQAIRLAFLGPVSPVTLAESVIAARRTPMATGFQLIEILGCLRRVEQHGVAPGLLPTWTECIAVARKRIEALLTALIEREPSELGGTSFRAYYKAILRPTP